MLVGMYAAATQMDAMGQNHDIIARNLANANTDGYKRNVASFKTIMLGGEGETGSTNGTIIEKVNVDFTPGKLAYTGSDFDLAIKGNGFFTVETDDGMVYTRLGKFIISPQREIITPGGGRLLGSGGAFQIPPGTKKIFIDESGTVNADDKKLGKLKITHFPNPNTLIQHGGSTFKPEDPGNAGENARDYTIAQGYVEKSNVNSINEMIAMIVNMRSYQMGQNVMSKSMTDTLSGLIKLAAQAG